MASLKPIFAMFFGSVEICTPVAETDTALRSWSAQMRSARSRALGSTAGVLVAAVRVGLRQARRSTRPRPWFFAV